MVPNESATVIGRSIKISGEISGADDLVVDGKVEGVVRLAGGRLTVRAEGNVRAAVLAQDVVVMGRIEGDIRATGRVELRGGASVVGDIFAARLSIQDEALLQGHVDPSRSTEPLPASAGAGLRAASRPSNGARAEARSTPLPEREDLFSVKPLATEQQARPGDHQPPALAAAARTFDAAVGRSPQSTAGDEAGRSTPTELAETKA